MSFLADAPSATVQVSGDSAKPEGQSATLSCTVSDPGWPLADLIWTKGGTQQKKCKGVKTCELSVNPVVAGSTTYNCEADNTVGKSAQASFTLTGQGRKTVIPVSYINLNTYIVIICIMF